MISLVSIGLLSGLFFSSTFILNRLMSLEGGHWVWSGSLRYGFMVIILVLALPLLQGLKSTQEVFRLFFQHWLFWTMAGTVGFGGFYSLLCFSADHAPGWVVAATWQLTIIASLFVLMGFGRRFPKKIWLFSALIFAGVLLINASHVGDDSLQTIIFGGLPVLAAAFCYPIGNQLVWEAKTGHRHLPNISSRHLDNPFNKILLLTLGAIPFWLLLIVINNPPPPSQGQLLTTAMVALLSGVLATGLFFLARNRANNSSELAAVDATQASEVVFALIGEMLLFQAPFPGIAAVTGIVLVFSGLFFFIRFQEKPAIAFATLDEFYQAVETLIVKLREEAHAEATQELHTLLHEMAWTTGSELLAELYLALGRLEANYHGPLRDNIAACRHFAANHRKILGLG